MEENTDTEVQSQQEFSFWNLPIFTLIFIVLITALVFYPVIASFQAGDPAAAGSATWRAIFFLIIGYLGGSHAAKNYAPKINGNQSWAFIIPYTFSLVGFGFYWLYYLYKRDKPGSQYPQENKKSIFRTILMIIGAVVLVIFILIILSYIVLGSGISTTQKSQETFQVATVSTIAPVGSSTAFYSYENKSLGFKINYPTSWTIQTKSYESGASTINFLNPSDLSMASVTVVNGDYPLDDVTNNFIESIRSSPSTQNFIFISKEGLGLSGNDANLLVFDINGTNKGRMLTWIIKSVNKIYYLSYLSLEEQSSSSTLATIYPTILGSFTTDISPHYLQGSESQNPYAASGMYAQRILKCQQGMEDWDYCAQQCRLANQVGYSCGEQDLKQMWEKNH